MGELQTAVDTFPIWKAVLWIFYPMALLVGVELFLRALRDDDDDDEGGKGIRIRQQDMVPATVPSGALHAFHSFWLHLSSHSIQ